MKELSMDDRRLLETIDVFDDNDWQELIYDILHDNIPKSEIRNNEESPVSFLVKLNSLVHDHSYSLWNRYQLALSNYYINIPIVSSNWMQMYYLLWVFAAIKISVPKIQKVLEEQFLTRSLSNARVELANLEVVLINTLSDLNLGKSTVITDFIVSLPSGAVNSTFDFWFACLKYLMKSKQVNYYQHCVSKLYNDGKYDEAIIDSLLIAPIYIGSHKTLYNWLKKGELFFQQRPDRFFDFVNSFLNKLCNRPGKHFEDYHMKLIVPLMTYDFYPFPLEVFQYYISSNFFQGSEYSSVMKTLVAKNLTKFHSHYCMYGGDEEGFPLVMVVKKDSKKEFENNEIFFRFYIQGVDRELTLNGERIKALYLDDNNNRTQVIVNSFNKAFINNG